MLVPQRVDELVDSAGLFNLGELVAVLPEQRHGLSVEVHLDVRKSAFACRVKLLGPSSINVPKLPAPISGPDP